MFVALKLLHYNEKKTKIHIKLPTQDLSLFYWNIAFMSITYCLDVLE